MSIACIHDNHKVQLDNHKVQLDIHSIHKVVRMDKFEPDKGCNNALADQCKFQTGLQQSRQETNQEPLPMRKLDFSYETSYVNL